jgi:predicted ArsR family transcriptional regulator
MQTPIHKQPEKYGRSGLWAVMRKMKTFTVRDLFQETGTADRTAWEYVKSLEKAGYVVHRATQQTSTGKGQHIYELVRDIGIEAPRVRRDGSEVTKGRIHEQLWRTMRILGDFSTDELAATASTEEHPVKRETARRYITHLVKAGYIRITRKGRVGGKASPKLPARYKFIPAMYTGPKPPKAQRVRQVYDPNTKEVVWRSKSGKGGAS